MEQLPYSTLVPGEVALNNMRISSTEPSSMILSQTNKLAKNVDKGYHKSAKWDGKKTQKLQFQ